MSSTAGTHDYSVSFFSVIIIAQSDVRNIEHVIGWLKKVSLDQLPFE